MLRSRISLFVELGFRHRKLLRLFHQHKFQFGTLSLICARRPPRYLYVAAFALPRLTFSPVASVVFCTGVFAVTALQLLFVYVHGSGSVCTSHPEHFSHSFLFLFLGPYAVIRLWQNRYFWITPVLLFYFAPLLLPSLLEPLSPFLRPRSIAWHRRMACTIYRIPIADSVSIYSLISWLKQWYVEHEARAINMHYTIPHPTHSRQLSKFTSLNPNNGDTTKTERKAFSKRRPVTARSSFDDGVCFAISCHRIVVIVQRCTDGDLSTAFNIHLLSGSPWWALRFAWGLVVWYRNTEIGLLVQEVPYDDYAVPLQLVLCQTQSKPFLHLSIISISLIWLMTWVLRLPARDNRCWNWWRLLFLRHRWFSYNLVRIRTADDWSLARTLSCRYSGRYTWIHRAKIR